MNIDLSKMKKIKIIRSYIVPGQIDFEASEYENDQPTDWASFSHNSDWADIKAGFKGVLHKFTLLNLARAQSKLEGILVLTPKAAEKVMAMTKEEYEAGKPAKPSTSQDYINPTNLAFAVSKGIRTKFAPIFFKDSKEQLMIDGKPVFFEEDSKLAKYTTDLKKQFELIFQKAPEGDDMKNFNSFVGLVELMKKYSSQEIIEDFFINQLVSKTLWCKAGCQGLERNNPEGDLEIKSAMVNYLYENFPYLKSYQSQIDTAIAEYYENYRMIEISENFIPFGSKLSAIFESVENATKKNLEPMGWKFFNEKRLKSEKINVLTKIGFSDKEIAAFLHSAPNSRNVNDIIKKVKSLGYRNLENFLRYEFYEKKDLMKDYLKRGY